MDLLTQLGVNSSLAYQLGIFLVVYAILKYVLFTPYFKAYNERNARTVGQTELAEQYVTETRELEQRFALRATEVNERYKAVYDQIRLEGVKDYERVVGEARGKAKQLTDTSRKSIEKEVESARGQLKQEITAVSKLINHQLIGKDFGT